MRGIRFLVTPSFPWLALIADPRIHAIVASKIIIAVLDDAEEGIQRFAPRKRSDSAEIVDAVVLHKVVSKVGQYRVRRIGKNVGIRHTFASKLLVTDERGGQAHHVALAVADDGDRAFLAIVLLMPLARLRNKRSKPPRGMRAVVSSRAVVDETTRLGVHVFDLQAQKQVRHSAVAPQIRQRRAAVGKRATAPGIVFVEQDVRADDSQVFLVGDVTPTEADDGAGLGALYEVLALNSVLRLGTHEIARGCQLGAVLRGAQQALDRVVYWFAKLFSVQALVQSIAQAFLCRVEPFAHRVHAVHEDDDAGQRYAGHLANAAAGQRDVGGPSNDAGFRIVEAGFAHGVLP